MVWDVVVVGGGPAGLCAAIAAGEEGARSVVLEHLPKPGRKLLASGGGAGNLTHGGEIADFLPHYRGGDRPGEAGRFLRPALNAFSNRDLARFFADRGLPLAANGDGRVFPRSRQAADVLDLLLAVARRRRVELRTGVRVGSLQVEGSRFVVSGSGGEPAVEGRTVVVATGGRSYPSLGATGEGYRLAVSLGHSVVHPRPALVPLTVTRPAFAPFARCAGVSLQGAGVSVGRGGRRVAAARGDVLFTHRGLSGPAILNLSRDVQPGDVVRVSLLPGSGDPHPAEQRLIAEIEAHAKRTVIGLLRGMGVVACLARALVSSLRLDAGTVAAELPRDARHALAVSLAAEGGGHPFPVHSVGGWNEAMVTAGGVRLSEVDPHTIGSRLVPGLFFAGEVLDVDGATGGYNLQAAFSTGRLAGQSAGRLARGRPNMPPREAKPRPGPCSSG